MESTFCLMFWGRSAEEISLRVPAYFRPNKSEAHPAMRTMLLIPVLLTLGLTACHQEGPAERAGRSRDNARRRVQSTVSPPQGPAPSAGRKVDRTLGN
jgi:hypothetical protein